MKLLRRSQRSTLISVASASRTTERESIIESPKMLMRCEDNAVIAHEENERGDRTATNLNQSDAKF